MLCIMCRIVIFTEVKSFVPVFAVPRGRGKAVFVLLMSIDTPKSQNVCVDGAVQMRTYWPE